MRSIHEEFQAGMSNIYNSFFISFLSLKPLEERPLRDDYIIPIAGFRHNRLEADQINRVQMDSVNEYVNSLRRHMLNDIVICYERYATTMYVSYHNNLVRVDPAMLDDRRVNSSLFEKLDNLYSEEEKEFFSQLRHLRNSIIHYNGVYTSTNPLDYTFGDDAYHSNGHEGESITIELDSIIAIFEKVKSIVQRINDRFFELFVPS